MIYRSGGLGLDLYETLTDLDFFSFLCRCRVFRLSQTKCREIIQKGTFFSFLCYTEVQVWVKMTSASSALTWDIREENINLRNGT